MKIRRIALAMGVFGGVLISGLVPVNGQTPVAENEVSVSAAPMPDGAVGASDAEVAAPGSAKPAVASVGSAATVAGVAAPAAGTGSQAGEVIAPPPDKMIMESSGTNDLINVAVDNETLENVVTMFTRITGANIVATSTNLGGTVTVNLKDVEWKAALSSILDLHSLALVEKMPGSAVYSILPKPPDSQQPQVVETIFLNYTTSTELLPVISVMLASSASNATVSTIIELASRNALVIKTTEPNMRDVKRMIASMDIPSKQVCIEAKFMELNDNASKQLGIRWDSLAQFGVKLQAGPLAYDKKTERNRETSDQSTMSRSVVDTDMTSNKHRMDGAEFEEVKTEFVEAPPGSGNYIAQSTITPTRDHTFGTDNSDQLVSTDLNKFTRNITESQAAILEMDSFNVILSALKKTAGVQIVSNPKIIVTSGSTNAMFNVGDREPLIRTTKTEGTQNSAASTVTTLDTAITTDFIKSGYLETGIHLQVTPVVKTDDMIEAQIWPRLTHKTADKGVGSDGNTWPMIAVKEIKTKFTLRSGQTVAIGGLTSTSDNKVVTKIPLLGDIPLIGKYLFSHTSDAKSQTETIIFVTLSRAEPTDLKENTGIPADSELVHKRMIQRKMRQEEFDGELKTLEKAVEAERVQKARAVGHQELRK